MFSWKTIEFGCIKYEHEVAVEILFMCSTGVGFFHVLHEWGVVNWFASLTKFSDLPSSTSIKWPLFTENTFFGQFVYGPTKLSIRFVLFFIIVMAIVCVWNNFLTCVHLLERGVRQSLCFVLDCGNVVKKRPVDIRGGGAGCVLVRPKWFFSVWLKTFPNYFILYYTYRVEPRLRNMLIIAHPLPPQIHTTANTPPPPPHFLFQQKQQSLLTVSNGSCLTDCRYRT